jgi:hypothetical protein
MAGGMLFLGPGLSWQLLIVLGLAVASLLLARLAPSRVAVLIALLVP